MNRKKAIEYLERKEMIDSSYQEREFTKEEEKEIKKVMKAMSASLGVECDHCHNTEDMAVDTKHKLEAREMMVMVNDINKRYFKGEMEVTCKTCHRGQHEPSE